MTKEKTTDLLEKAINLAKEGIILKGPEPWQYVYAYFRHLFTFGKLKYNTYIDSRTTYDYRNIFFIIASQQQVYYTQKLIVKILSKNCMRAQFTQQGDCVTFFDNERVTGKLYIQSFHDHSIMTHGLKNFYPIFDHYTLEVHKSAKDKDLIHDVMQRAAYTNT